MSNSPAGHVSWPDSFDDAPLSSSERRKHARKKLVSSQAIVLDPNSRQPAKVVDLSEGGVGVHSDLPIEQGAICRLQLPVPNSNQIIEATCELAWNRTPNAGFRFTILTEKSQRQIKEWLSALDGANGGQEVPPDLQPNATPSALPQNDSAKQIRNAILAYVSDEALLGLVLEARGITQAEGAAVAVDDGSGMFCRASVGSAPDVGVRIQVDRGLSGECLRTGEIVVCYDTDTDPRVDPSVSRTLNLRSVVIVPIGPHEAPEGLLEVFFAKPRAFQESAVYALQELVAGFLAAAELPTVNPEPEPAPAVGLPQMASFARREATPGFVICDVCGQENSEKNRVCDKCDVPLPEALRYVDLNSPMEEFGLRSERVPTEPLQPPHRGGYRKKLLLMLMVAALLVLWQARSKINADSHVPGNPAGVIKLGIPDKTPEVQDQPPNLPLGTAPKERVSKTEEPAEAEVVVRNFESPMKAQPTKARPAKPSPRKPAISTSTIPRDTTLAKQTDLEQPAAEQPIRLPLNDEAALSAITTTPPPMPAKPKQPGFWKRLSKRIVPVGKKDRAASHK